MSPAGTSHHPDSIIAKREPPPLHPAGPVQAVCVDVIDLGLRVQEFKGKDPKLSASVAFVFQTKKVNPATGKRFELSREMTVSFGKKANLRKFIGDWRGARVTQQESEDGIDLAVFFGSNALLGVEHQTSATTERTYANIATIGPLVEGMAELEPDEYQRAEYWADRAAEYKKGADEFLAEQAKPIKQRLIEGAADDDLPF